jgi:hydroxyquinol 1,2-dioxygenase
MSVTDETSELAAREAALTEQVVASFAGAPDPRTRELLQALVRHAHAFAREVRLSEREWETAIGFLTRAGHITDDKRQEFILLSDVLGLSMLTIGINAPRDPSVTEPTVFGPFFVEGSPEVRYGGDIAEGVPGDPCWVEGRVTDAAGTPLADARIELWEADDDGMYDVQYGDDRTGGRAHTFTDEDGRYGVWSVKPTAYPIPGDGPVGDLLRVSERSPMRPAHLHYMVTAEGFQTLVTHCFVDGDPHLADDAVFGVKRSLIVGVEQQPPGDGPAGRTLEQPWWRMTFDLKLARKEGAAA